MARRRKVEADVGDGSSHDQIIRWYRERLSEPAALPWEMSQWEPIVLGPTWQIGHDGRWLLPDLTLGWDVLGWCGTWLQHGVGKPWRFTLEQARFVLWWYELDEDGVFVVDDAVLQRLKGWGKDPLAACLCATEALGPCRFVGWDDDGPIAADHEDAWIQTAAVALEQTKNTMRLFPGLFTREAKKRFRIQIGKTLVHALGDMRLIEAVTSSPTTLEGGRPTFILENETHHWLANNDGHEMADVNERNMVKSDGGTARRLKITNAYDPTQDSVAQRDREAYEDMVAAETLTTGILYDSIEAPPEAELTVDIAPSVIEAIRGDSTWLSTTRIVRSLLDTRNPPSRSRRWWYNQIVAAEDAWTDPQNFAGCEHAEIVVDRRDEVVLFFDGGKSDDATGLTACRLSDGHVLTRGMWQRPRGARGDDWIAPRAEIDDYVERAFVELNPVAFFADPSHARDDETDTPFWDGLIDKWHRQYRSRLRLWAVPGKQGHAVMWDMTSPARVQLFTEACERTALEIRDHELSYDADPRMRLHVRNARRYPNQYGISIWKGHRASQRKIDLAVCMVGARMLRRMVLNADEPQEEVGGEVYAL